jgi:hypothetical protein
METNQVIRRINNRDIEKEKLMRRIPPATAWLLIAAALALLSGQARGEEIPPLLTSKDPQAVIANLQNDIPPLLKKARVPGLQFALVRDAKIIWHQSFGIIRGSFLAVPVERASLSQFTPPAILGEYKSRLMRCQMKSGLAHGESENCRDAQRRRKSAGPPGPGKRENHKEYSVGASAAIRTS